VVEPIFLQKAKKYNPDKDDIRDWGIQEKLDGVRIQITIDNAGAARIYSRSIIEKTGLFNEYTDHLPHVVEEVESLGLTNQILDGEACVSLYDKHDANFGYASGTLNQLVENSLKRQEEMEKIRAVLFDAPLLQKPYRQRYEFLQEYIPDDYRYLEVNPMLLNHKDEYLHEFNRVISEGGEGIILYNLEGMYKHSPARCQVNKHLLKIKDVNEREVKVIGKEQGVGKCTGTLGALICEDYREFSGLEIFYS